MAEKQPWLTPYENHGFTSVVGRKGLINVPCQAGNTIKYSSRYQEIDAGHIERILYQNNELRTADYSNLAQCVNALGSHGILQISDAHQTHLCSGCKIKLKLTIINALKHALLNGGDNDSCNKIF